MKGHSNGRSIYLIAFIIFSTFIYAQVDTAWVRRYNGTGNYPDTAYAIAVDNIGNCYVTGTSSGAGTGNDYITIKYYPNGDTAWVRRYIGPWGNDRATTLAIDTIGYIYVTGKSDDINADPDYMTVKYFPNGDIAWTRRYKGSGNGGDIATDIAVDNLGDVYVTGSSFDSITHSDCVTIKYYPDGETAWIRRYNGSDFNADDRALTMTIDNSGNVYIAGYSVDLVTHLDYITIKYYSNGDTAWVKKYSGLNANNDAAHDITVDDMGNVYVTGFSEEESPYDNNYLTIKYFPNGDTAWIRRYNGSLNNDDGATAIAVDDSGNCFVTGFSKEIGSDYDMTTIKYNSIGDTIWIKRYNGPLNDADWATALSIDIWGNIYVTGSIHSFYGDDYATIKYYPNGDTAWTRIYNGPGNNNDRSTALAVDTSGNVYITGYNYDIGTYDDYATIKYSPTGEVDERWITHVSVGQKIDIFPNPCRKVTSISIGQEAAGKESRIYDITGRLVRSFPQASATHLGGPFDLDLTGLAPGVYFVQVDGVKAVGKIVITK